MASKRDTKSQELFPHKLLDMPADHYVGDKPNPHLRSFVDRHIQERPYKDGDDYAVQPSVGSIKVSKRNPVYGLHAYDSKKPPEAVRQYIEHFTKPGDLVFDPFVGSGMTAVAALLTGRKCMAVDLSPLAAFVTSQYCSPVDVVQLQKATERILRQLEKDRERLYSTTCGRCGKRAEIYFTVYSQTYQCVRCMTTAPIFDSLANNESAEDGEKFDAYCPHCAAKGVTERISTRQERHGYVPVLIQYECACSAKEQIDRTHCDGNKRERKIFNEVDLPALHKVEKTAPKNWYPTRRMLWEERDEGAWGVLWRPYHGEIRRVDQFFTQRNLDALSCLLAAINAEPHPRIRSALRFLFSAFVLSQSKLQRFHPGSTFPNMIAPGLLYVAPMVKEYNVFQWFEGKVKSAVKGFAELQAVNPTHLMLSTESATALDRIPSNSVDFIFTDPPYSGRIQYGELNFIQEAWLDFSSDWRRDEIIVNTVRNKDEAEWQSLLKAAFKHCFRVLKPGRWLSLCYHDSAEGTWALIQDILAESGFIAESTSGAVAIDTKEKSLKQITADKITKRDLVINFRKPRPSEAATSVSISGKEDARTFAEKVRQIIRDYLVDHPGTTKDLIYDEVVSKMVRAGQMEAHNFHELLATVAVEVKTPVKKDLFRNEDPNLFGTHEICRWYLKETELDVSDAAESAKEDKAAEKLESFMKAHLKKHPEIEGVHYSDLFEQYVYSVKEKARRQLADFLPDYFYKTEAGTWRPPTSTEEAASKAEGRAKGTGRRVKRYIALLEQGVAIPSRDRPNDASLAEWIRHCKRSGLYEQGKLLYEKGGINLDKLPEEIMVGVEEDYQVCVRMIARNSGPKTGKKRKGSKE